MNIRYTSMCLVMTGGLLLFASGLLHAQLGSGSSAPGPGGPEMTSPGTGSNTHRDRSGSAGEDNLKPSPESSGMMRPEGAIIMKPTPGEGLDHRPDSRATDPGDPAGKGSKFGRGSGSGGTGSKGRIGASGAARPGEGQGSSSGK